MKKRVTMKQFSLIVPFLFVLGMATQFVPSPAEAQETEGDGASFFLKKGFESVPKRKQDDGNALENNTYINNLLDDVDKVLATTQEGIVWKGVDEEPELNKERKIDPVVRKHQVNQYQPLAGHQNLLGAKAIQKAYDQALEGPVAEWNITLTQTEPAIAAGIHNALMQTSQTLNARYLSEIVFYDQLDSAQPWARTKILNAYNRCIQNYLQKDKSSWYQALQICSGDSASTTSKDPEYDDASTLPQKSGEATGDSGSMWNLKGHHRHQKDGTAIKPNEDIVSVVDELFAELLKNNNVDQNQISEARDSWLELFGDVEFHAISDSDTTVDSQDVQGKNVQAKAREENKGAYSTTELKIVRIPPSKRASLVLAKMIQDRYKTLMKEMEEFCKEKANPGGGSPYKAHKTSGQQDYKRYEKEYWQDKADEERLQLLSTEGYAMNAAVGNLFLELAVDGYTADGSDLTEACTQFASGGDFYDYKDIEPKSRSHDIASVYWNYSKFIAFGQLLSSYKSALKFVAERSAEPGTTSFQYKVNAIQMILETARTDNIPMVQMGNAQKLRAFLSYVYKKKTQGSGMGGTQVTAGVRAGAGGKQKKTN